MELINILIREIICKYALLSIINVVQAANHVVELPVELLEVEDY
jgi:hypothetical protein